MSTWKNSSEIMDAIHQTHSRLLAGKIDVAQARAEATALKTACKLLALQVEVARVKGTLAAQGAVPAFGLE